MRNRLKTLGILAVFVAASFVGVKGSAAAGPSMGSVSLPAQATAVNLMTQTSFSLNTTAAVDPAQWQTDLNQAEVAFYGDPTSPYSSCVWNPNYNDYDCTPGPLEMYTIACWNLSADVIGPGFSWKCGEYHSNPFGPNASYNSVAALFAINGVSLGTTGYQQCSWLMPWDGSACGAYDSTSVPGIDSPAETGQNMMPNLDQYVGKTVNLLANENWCSALGPPAPPITTYDFATNWTTTQSYISCYGSAQDVPLGLAARLTASSDSGPCHQQKAGQTPSCSPVVSIAKVSMQAGPTDCHVPKVKGLTLRKAKARLHKAHCGSTVRYVKGTRAGRVKYQPLKVGTGRPRGYKVKLAVVR